ncbi:MAG: hypothetical protein ACYTDT_05670 [Planctomycetota bacterium]|jgi:hypothetical protein
MLSSQHSSKDMLKAIKLSLGAQQVSAAGFALLWSVAVSTVALKILTMFEGFSEFSPASILGTLNSVRSDGVPPWFVATCLPLGVIWLVGFQWFFTGVFRSGALQLAGHSNDVSVPAHIKRDAALVIPIAFVIPVLLLAFAPLWALTLDIEGWAGTVTMALTLPFALIPVAIGAFIGAIIKFSSPLFVPAVTVDGDDVFDSIGRSVSYAVRNPVYYVWLMIQKVVVTCLGIAIAAAILGVMWGAVVAGAWLIKGRETVDAAVAVVVDGSVSSLSPDWVPMVLGLFFWGTVAIAVSWIMVVSANGDLMTYVILRQRTDGIPYGQVHTWSSVEKLLTATKTAEMAEEARKRWDDEQATGAEKPQESANE